MLPEQQQRILGYFIEEAKDHLNTIEQGLLNLSDTLADPEMVNEIFRAAHSIKGGAAMLGIDSIQRTSHRLEDYFKLLKECPSIQINQNIESLFLRLFDNLQALLIRLETSDLTEDVAQQLMSEVEPVFATLEQQLQLQVHQTGNTHEDKEASLSPWLPAFQDSVPEKLRQLLQLFKQPETPQIRQQLEEICNQLVQLGEQYNLSGWCTLCETAAGAIASENNTYRTLAPLIIKELKQAQELVVADRADEITTCQQLQALSIATFLFDREESIREQLEPNQPQETTEPSTNYITTSAEYLASNLDELNLEEQFNAVAAEDHLSNLFLVQPDDNQWQETSELSNFLNLENDIQSSQVQDLRENLAPISSEETLALNSLFDQPQDASLSNNPESALCNLFTTPADVESLDFSELSDARAPVEADLSQFWSEEPDAPTQIEFELEEFSLPTDAEELFASTDIFSLPVNSSEALSDLDSQLDEVSTGEDVPPDLLFDDSTLSNSSELEQKIEASWFTEPNLDKTTIVERTFADNSIEFIDSALDATPTATPLGADNLDSILEPTVTDVFATASFESFESESSINLFEESAVVSDVENTTQLLAATDTTVAQSNSTFNTATSDLSAITSFDDELSDLWEEPIVAPTSESEDLFIPVSLESEHANLSDRPTVVPRDESANEFIAATDAIAEDLFINVSLEGESSDWWEQPTVANSDESASIIAAIDPTSEELFSSGSSESDLGSLFDDVNVAPSDESGVEFIAAVDTTEDLFADANLEGELSVNLFEESVAGSTVENSTESLVAMDATAADLDFAIDPVTADFASVSSDELNVDLWEPTASDEQALELIGLIDDAAAEDLFTPTNLEIGNDLFEQSTITSDQEALELIASIDDAAAEDLFTPTSLEIDNDLFAPSTQESDRSALEPLAPIDDAADDLFEQSTTQSDEEALELIASIDDAAVDQEALELIASIDDAAAEDLFTPTSLEIDNDLFAPSTITSDQEGLEPLAPIDDAANDLFAPSTQESNEEALELIAPIDDAAVDQEALELIAAIDDAAAEDLFTPTNLELGNDLFAPSTQESDQEALELIAPIDDAANDLFDPSTQESNEEALELIAPIDDAAAEDLFTPTSLEIDNDLFAPSTQESDRSELELLAPIDDAADDLFEQSTIESDEEALELIAPIDDAAAEDLFTPTSLEIDNDLFDPSTTQSDRSELEPLAPIDDAANDLFAPSTIESNEEALELIAPIDDAAAEDLFTPTSLELGNDLFDPSTIANSDEDALEFIAPIDDAADDLFEQSTTQSAQEALELIVPINDAAAEDLFTPTSLEIDNDLFAPSTQESDRSELELLAPIDDAANDLFAPSTQESNEEALELIAPIDDAAAENLFTPTSLEIDNDLFDPSTIANSDEDALEFIAPIDDAADDLFEQSTQESDEEALELIASIDDAAAEDLFTPTSLEIDNDLFDPSTTQSDQEALELIASIDDAAAEDLFTPTSLEIDNDLFDPSTQESDRSELEPLAPIDDAANDLFDPSTQESNNEEALELIAPIDDAAAEDLFTPTNLELGNDLFAPSTTQSDRSELELLAPIDDAANDLFDPSTQESDRSELELIAAIDDAAAEDLFTPTSLELGNDLFAPSTIANSDEDALEFIAPIDDAADDLFEQSTTQSDEEALELIAPIDDAAAEDLFTPTNLELGNDLFAPSTQESDRCELEPLAPIDDAANDLFDPSTQESDRSELELIAAIDDAAAEDLFTPTSLELGNDLFAPSTIANSDEDALEFIAPIDDAAEDLFASASSQSEPSVDLFDEDSTANLVSALEIEDATTNSAVDEIDEFADLEALLDDKATSNVLPSSSKTSVPTVAATPSNNDEFGDLEQLLSTPSTKAVSATPVEPQQKSAAVNNSRRSTFEQMMRVPVKHLDNISNLVGELVIYRNSLEQDQERLRQFLDNLLHQVQQLSDVGDRMQELYERSLLEASLLNSRQGSRLVSVSSDTSASPRGHATGINFDALEMDRFTGFHTLAQEMIELIVRVREASSDIEFVTGETEQVARQFRQVTTQLQEGITRSRMVPFAQIAERLPRAVRDISLKYGKQAELQIEGKDTLIDKVILEQLYDPMTHLVNNAITHGIESKEERERSGKLPGGQITVRAFYQGNQTVITVSDDGAGIDPERVKAKAIDKGLITPEIAANMSRLDVYNLLFHPGFSTKEQVDEFAGRGVGMDVVFTSLGQMRGTITTDSTLGKGTTFTIRLPLTLSICKALYCLSDKARIAFPMDGVEQMLDLPVDNVVTDAQGQACIPWRNSLLPFRHLKELLSFNRQLGRGTIYGSSRDDDMISIVVLRSADTFLALQVDQVLGEQEIVIKQFEAPAPKPFGVAGATVLGDGRIMPIADVLELIELSMGRIRQNSTPAWANSLPPETSSAAKTEPVVLIVDDSITVRELLSMTFTNAGYRVEQARDGQEAWDKLRDGLPCDLVFCDIEMPRMDGLELLSRMQKDPKLSQVPISMLTSRGSDRHRQMALQLGASGYFTKPYLEEALLDGAQRMLRGEVLLASNSNA